MEVLGDDAQLTAALLAAQDGDENAFRTVYRAVQPRLLGYIRTLVGDADAEDVASEAWLQIARDLNRFSGDADRFRGWAARIARNRALDHIRMRGRRPATGGDETELADRAAESDTADEAMEALSTGRTMALIAQLPQDQAEAVVLRVVVGLDANSAAKTLGKRPGAVRTAAHRGLKRLAELVSADLPTALGDLQGLGTGPERPGETEEPADFERPRETGKPGGLERPRDLEGTGDLAPHARLERAGERAERGESGEHEGADGDLRGATAYRAAGVADRPGGPSDRTTHGTGHGTAGYGGGIGSVLPQRVIRPEAAAVTGVTQSSAQAQKDM